MQPSRYLYCLAADFSRLRTVAAAADLSAPVPSCPAWTTGDLVFHVAEVYLHKATIMRTGEWPSQWPLPGLVDEPELALLDRTYDELTGQFARLGPDATTPTWFDPDQSVAFWMRRMAQETVIHRIDAELAAGVPPTPAPADLAIDGVDEVLKRFLGYSTEELAQMKGEHLAGPGGTDTIAVTAGDITWTVFPAPEQVTVADGQTASSSQPRVTISASPDAMLRWLWGRAGQDAVQVVGDPAWADYLRRLLVATTQ